MKNSSKRKKSKKKISMKEAFEKVKVIRVEKTADEGNKDFRKWWWDYPLFIQKVIRYTRPLCYIVIFSLLAVGMCMYLINSSFMEVIRSNEKDSFVEGSVGAVSSFNPLYLTQNAIDKSIQELVFERFISIDRNGDPKSGIAVHWEVSEDYLTYTFDIENGHFWQDGEPLTIDDVIFTFESAIKLADKHGEDSVGVPLVDVEVNKIDEDTVEFVLEDTNATFFEAVSIYIVPEHRLEGVDLDDMHFDVFTNYPLGSGPYKVTKTEPNIVMLETSEYYPDELSIQHITYRIYDDIESLEVAFRNGELDAVSGIDSGNMDFLEEYSGYTKLETSIDQRTKIIFFNTRRDSLNDMGTRRALSYLTNKEELLARSGIPGVVSLGVLPSSSWAFNPDAEAYLYDPEKAQELLEELEYIRNKETGYYEGDDSKILSFTISYLENESNTRLVSALKSLWEDEGIILNLEPLTYDQITQEVISTRNFEMLLYEVETTIDPDQYNLWHSLKVDYPDLNLSGYEYDRVDILLEEARIELDRDIRGENYDLFQKYLMDDAPSLFLYHPIYIYVVPENLTGPDLEEISFPEERFENILDWEF